MIQLLTKRGALTSCKYERYPWWSTCVGLTRPPANGRLTIDCILDKDKGRPGVYRKNGVLVIKTESGETHSVDVSYQIEDIKILDFGESESWDAFPTRTISVSNSQPWEIRGTASSQVDWIQVSPEEFVCPPKKEVQIAVTVRKPLNAERKTIFNSDQAVIINYGTNREVYIAQLKTRAKPGSIPHRVGDITFEFGLDAASKLPIEELPVEHERPWSVSVSVQSMFEWLKVEPETFYAPAKEVSVVKLSLTDAARQLGAGQHFFENALVVTMAQEKKQHSVLLKIAEKGSSGTDTVKLHFEIRKDGKPIDPLRLLPRR